MNAIYLHSTDGFTFLENVPEKPENHPNFKSGMDQYSEPLETNGFWQKKLKDYERALAECIEKRMVIGNPEVALDRGMILLTTNDKGEMCGKAPKEGEIYPWPGTWEKRRQYRVPIAGNWIDIITGWNGSNGDEIREVVILSLPKEEKPPTPLADMKAIFEPVNSSMSEKEEPSEAWKAWERENRHHPTGINPHAFILGYKTAKSEPVVSQDQEPEAVRFANWISLNNWEAVQSGGMWYQYIDPHTYLKKTTSELYELFSRKPID